MTGADRQRESSEREERYQQLVELAPETILIHDGERIILANAAALICGHNHPAGDPQPSQEDRTLTYRLYKAGQLLGIEVLDHVIIGDGTEHYFSFADAEILHKERD